MSCERAFVTSAETSHAWPFWLKPREHKGIQHFFMVAWSCGLTALPLTSAPLARCDGNASRAAGNLLGGRNQGEGADRGHQECNQNGARDPNGDPGAGNRE